MMVAFAVSLTAKADYWMTFCKTPGGQVVVYKTQVWYQKMPGDAPSNGSR